MGNSKIELYYVTGNIVGVVCLFINAYLYPLIDEDWLIFVFIVLLVNNLALLEKIVKNKKQ